MKTRFDFIEKIISILLCVAIIMPYIPVTVFAASDTIWVGGVELSMGQYLATGSSTPTTTKPKTGGYAYWEVYYSVPTLFLNNYTYERTRKRIF